MSEKHLETQSGQDVSVPWTVVYPVIFHTLSSGTPYNGRVMSLGCDVRQQDESEVLYPR
jgi:hypothetical protein